MYHTLVVSINEKMNALQISFVLIHLVIVVKAQNTDNTIDCNGDFTTRTGTFTSPSYETPHQGEANESCQWRITAASDEKIVLNITDIDIEKVAECAIGYVEVRDGHWIESPLLGRYCGHGKLNPIVSTGNKMYISYVYNDRKDHRGFSAKYRGICGGDIFVANETQLVSPGYPDLYPLDKECVWEIEVHESRKAAIQFQFFDVEPEANCSNDYIEVRDGWSEESALIGKFCNQQLPPEILSDSNSLYIKFVSDNSVQRGGFSATVINDIDECATEEEQCEQICINTIGSYKCACKPGFELKDNGRDCQVTCGGTINAISGTIETPSSPDVTYPLNRTCTWEIVTPPQHKIALSFTRFNIGNESCTEDSVGIFSNITDFLDTPSDSCGSGTFNSTLLLEGTFCGNTTPGSISPRSNILKIVLDSYHNSQSSGFALDFSSTLDGCSVYNGNCVHECLNATGVTKCSCPTNFISGDEGRNCIDETSCTFELSSSSLNIFSPNFPNPYPANKKCRWQFTSTPGHWIKLTFNNFTLEATCRYDNVTVYDFKYGNQLGTFCGTSLPTPIISPRYTLYLTFSSDGSNQYRGFFANYETVCNGTLHAISSERRIYSHANFTSDNYDINADCFWNITADANSTITLSFLIFEIEDSKNCDKDYVEVFDGENTTTTSFGKFCGNERPSRFCSTSNSLLVHFHTDDTNEGRGFSLEYKALNNTMQNFRMFS